MNLNQLLENELRVPIQRLRAEIHTGREHVGATLFLAPAANVEEIFEEASPFVPADVEGRTRFFARSAIAAIAVEYEAAPGSLSTLDVPYELRAVSVRMQGGVDIEGELMLSPMVRRTLDVLNQSTKSFAVRSSGKVVHIAKAHVVRVEEVA